MILKESDLYQLSRQAISAAYKAGTIISENSSKSLLVKNKKDTLQEGSGQRVGDTLASQVVTEIDIKCQEVILENLISTFEQYDLALLAEESPDNGSRHQKDYFWCIDPLDGTLAFTKSEPGYSVSIALVSKEGVPQIGVIYDPFSDVLYHAIKGQGAFRNEKEWSPEFKGHTENSQLNFVTDRSFMEHPFYQKVLSLLSKIAKDNKYDGLESHFYGGAAMDACMVLELAPAVFFKLPKAEDGGGCIWDYAASSCIFNEVGAHVSDIYGEALDLNNPETLFMNQKGVLFASEKHLADLLIRNIIGIL